KHVTALRQVITQSGGSNPLAGETKVADESANTVTAVIRIITNNVNLNDKAGEKIDYYPRNNVLIIKASQEKMLRVKDVLALLDRERPQVIIKVQIAEVAETNDFQYGMEFAARRRSDSSAMTFNTFQATLWPQNYVDFLISPTTAGFQGSSVSFSTRTGATQEPYVYTLRALEELGFADIVGEPEIVVAQGEVATIRSGEDTPVQVVVVTGTRTDISTEFRNTGVKLYVTPITINRDGVHLNVLAEYSVVTGYTAASVSNAIANPIIAIRKAETTLFLTYDQTLRIGGLKLTEKRKDDSGIPGINKIPILRDILGSKRREGRDTELYFYVTPALYQGTQVLLPVE
ncbi:MAG: hypothetical protein V2A58_00500, partial [Planctomycetota bacterium]